MQIRKFLAKSVSAPLLLLVSFLWYGHALSQEHPTEHPTAKQTEKSLYGRLGGIYSIAAVVDDFIERLLVNDVLNSNPKINEARIRVPKAGLKYHVTALVCQVTGGPEQYAGRSMKESHKHLNITDKEWKAMMDDFKKSLDSFKVPEAEQKELIAIVESTKPDIVVKTTK